MSSERSRPPVQFSEAEIEQFQTQGFLVLKQLLNQNQVQALDARLDPLFATCLETGIYPDEWHGRPGLSQPNATRQMSGLWRCDRTVASFSLSAEIARLNAVLGGWSGGRFALDSCWIKPPDAPPVLFHRNNAAVSCIQPTTLVTCWIALTETTPEMGTLEVVPGSHGWLGTDPFRFLHAPQEDYRTPLWKAAAAADQAATSVPLTLTAGDCVFLHGNLWHGSGRNRSDRPRRSFSVSTLPADAQFQPPGIGVGYIFSRYRRIGSQEMDESFFPILWTETGYRSPMVLEYCEDALSLQSG